MSDPDTKNTTPDYIAAPSPAESIVKPRRARASTRRSTIPRPR